MVRRLWSGEDAIPFEFIFSWVWLISIRGVETRIPEITQTLRPSVGTLPAAHRPAAVDRVLEDIPLARFSFGWNRTTYR
jgi:hypothetical protein